MPNPWLRFLALRGPLQALPPAWPPTLLLWGLALAAVPVVGLVAPNAVQGAAAFPMLAAAAMEILLCWLLLTVAGRCALLAWLLRYWFRLWQQALLAARGRVAAITAAMAAALVLLHLGLGG